MCKNEQKPKLEPSHVMKKEAPEPEVYL